MPGMQSIVRKVFNKIPDKVSGAISLVDCLSSGLAIFNLKYPSLLKYDEDRQSYATNLKNLFHIDKAPSDTYLRERLDEVDPSALRACFTKLFSCVQRSKYLENYIYHQGTYLISVDATGYFSSKKVHCESCCVKNHKDDTKTYYHQILGAVLVHPDCKQVIPFMPEPISKHDGNKKNDCEINAAKRLLSDLRREHPHLAVTIVEDGLYSKAPHIKLLKTLNMHYIIGAKAGDHTWLYDYVKNTSTESYTYTDEKGYRHDFNYVNDVPLNASNEDVRVNFLSHTEISNKGKVQKFTWVTDFKLTDKTVYSIMRGGRARWKIENETFNTLKNQGYNFEHNFGHGKKHLSHVFATLMLMAFLIDQIQAMACPLFQAALKKEKRISYLWPRILGIFELTFIENWEVLYKYIAQREGPIAHLNSS
jgi:hypothetical protein